MRTMEIKKSLRLAFADLQKAQNELNRPEEDLVPLCVCSSARHSMSAMMRLFLLTKTLNTEEDASLKALFRKCGEYEKEFNRLNLDNLLCQSLKLSACEDKNCISLKNLNACVALTGRLKDIVSKILQPEDKEE